jgi:ATP-dependent exoDNAse (exonuclease V) alpha subunit
LNATKHLCLEKGVKRLKHQHLQWSEIDVLRNIMKFKLPPSIPLTPQWLKVGAANGTTGIVTKLEFDSESNVCSISIALNPSAYVQIVRKKSIQNKYDSQGHFYKTSFPLMLGYAITGHKSQGATISSKVVIHIRESFARGLVYVMLSRVTSQNFLKIVNNLQPLDIQPMLPWFLENVNIVVN